MTATNQRPNRLKKPTLLRMPDLLPEAPTRPAETDEEDLDVEAADPQPVPDPDPEPEADADPQPEPARRPRRRTQAKTKKEPARYTSDGPGYKLSVTVPADLDTDLTRLLAGRRWSDGGRVGKIEVMRALICVAFEAVDWDAIDWDDAESLATQLRTQLG